MTIPVPAAPGGDETSDCCTGGGADYSGDPNGLHTFECPVYLANVAAFTKRPEHPQPPTAPSSPDPGDDNDTLREQAAIDPGTTEALRDETGALDIRARLTAQLHEPMTTSRSVTTAIPVTWVDDIATALLPLVLAYGDEREKAGVEEAPREGHPAATTPDPWHDSGGSSADDVPCAKGTCACPEQTPLSGPPFNGDPLRVRLVNALPWLMEHDLEKLAPAVVAYGDQRAAQALRDSAAFCRTREASARERRGDYNDGLANAYDSAADELATRADEIHGRQG